MVSSWGFLHIKNETLFFLLLTKQSHVIPNVLHFTSEQYKLPVFFVLDPHPVIMIREEKE
jgi:hypothetical protein